MVKLGSWKALSFWTQNSYIWWYWRVLAMILLNCSGIAGTVLSLFHQFIGRPQEVELLVTSFSWAHHVLPDFSSLKPEPSEASQCLPNEDFWKCHAASWPQYIPEDVALHLADQRGKYCNNIILFESIYAINSWTVGQQFFFSYVEIMNCVISCKAVFSTYLDDP